MPATKLQANWDVVKHGTTVIQRVTSVNFTLTGTATKFAGDTARFETHAAVLMTRVTASVVSADIATLIGIVPGTMAAFLATHKDANLAAGGDILYTLSNAIWESCNATGAFGAFGSATGNMSGLSPDGQTNPLAFTRA